MRTLKILDTTLRDGEQSPGCSMHINEKLEIAEALESLGVDIIEAGFPVMSASDFKAVSEIAKIIKNCEVASLCRCVKKDIDLGYDAIKNAECPRLHLFIATSPIHLNYKYNSTESEVLSYIEKSIKYAKKYLSNIQFSFEDATRTPIDFLTQATQVAVDSGATTINIPDTVGYITPNEISKIFKHLKQNVKGIKNVDLSVHCHNDLGLAVSNTLSAVIAGATQIEGTINGIGERAGNVALEEIIMNIKTRKNYYNFNTKIDTQKIYKTSTLVASIIGMKIPPNKAIIGANAFAHEAGIHQHGVMKNRKTYEIMSPEDIGKPDNKIILGKHSGRHAFENLLIDMGFNFPPEKVNEYFAKFKNLTERKKNITRRDIEALLPRIKRNTNGHIFKLVNYEIASYKNSAFSEITLVSDNLNYTEKESGDGPVDASFKAINNIIGKNFQLIDFSIHSVTEGKDALGEASVKLCLGNDIMSGRGVSTDVLESAILAYIAAANKLLGLKNEKEN